MLCTAPKTQHQNCYAATVSTASNIIFLPCCCPLSPLTRARCAAEEHGVAAGLSNGVAQEARQRRIAILI